MFTRKIRSVLDKLLPKENKKPIEKKHWGKVLHIRRNIFFKEYGNGKEIWKAGVIDKRIGRLMYIIKNPKETIKGHHNQIRKTYSEDINNQKVETMEVIYDFLRCTDALSSPWGETFK